MQNKKYLSGWSFCNLTTINGAKCKTKEQYFEACKAASFIGTLQAGYTNFKYLSEVSRRICERDALLGVSMTGQMDSPEIIFDKNNLQQGAQIVNEVNKQLSAILKINPAVRTTVVKPEGTSSLALGCVGSGIHARHSKKFIRRITANPIEPIFKYFCSINPHMCIKKPNGDWVIEFAVLTPDDAIVKDDLTALEFLEKVKLVQQNWVIPGTVDNLISPGLTHNVSNTVTVKPDEWEEVKEYIWQNKEYFTGISLLPATGDKDYAFAPNEAVVTEADEARWLEIIKHYKPVDYSKMVEEVDNTDLKGEVACGAGGCEVK